MAETSPWPALPKRGRVSLAGFVASVTYPAATAAPVFSAVLTDAVPLPGGRTSEIHHVRLHWVGQRRVPGIVAGARLSVTGHLTTDGDEPVLYDPRYEILEADEEYV